MAEQPPIEYYADDGTDEGVLVARYSLGGGLEVVGEDAFEAWRGTFEDWLGRPNPPGAPSQSA